MPKWTWAAASRRGTSHERTGEGRQDAYRCVRAGPRKSIFIGVACDGAGSASHGGFGAMLASRRLSQRAKEYFSASRELPSDDTILEWVDQARDQIASLARRRGLTLRDFATTVVAVISKGAQSVTVHIGDGAAVGRCAKSGTWEPLSWPEHGEYASTTYFLTDEGGPRVRVSRRTSPIDRLAIFTDGIERLALDFAANQPHAPFFSTISQPVASSDATGCDVVLSHQLGSYLSADAVNARTDDDKTLIIASRK